MNRCKLNPCTLNRCTVYRCTVKPCTLSLALAMVGVLSSLALAADPPAASKAATKPASKPAAAAATAPAAKARLPKYYGRVADATQKEKLVAIAQQHSAAIAQKRAELKALTDKRDAELDAVLTADQRQQIAKLKEDAKAKRPASAKADAAPAAKAATAKKA
jgi:hypothetical protein